jgi:hypothetical protein
MQSSPTHLWTSSSPARALSYLDPMAAAAATCALASASAFAPTAAVASTCILLASAPQPPPLPPPPPPPHTRRARSRITPPYVVHELHGVQHRHGDFVPPPPPYHMTLERDALYGEVGEGRDIYPDEARCAHCSTHCRCALPLVGACACACSSPH